MEESRLKTIQNILDRYSKVNSYVDCTYREIHMEPETDMEQGLPPEKPLDPAFDDSSHRHFGVYDGETRYGPHLWRFRRNIPWKWILDADGIQPGGMHVRTGLMIWAMASAYRAYELRPVRICRDDRDHIGINGDKMTQYLRDLASAGLISAEFHPRRKSKVLPISLTTAKEMGRWRILRGVWWGPLSHISCHASHSALMAYLFLSMHFDRRLEKSLPDPELPGWIRPRRDFERGTKELREHGLIIRDRLMEYQMPVLFKPADGVELKPGWLTPTPKKRNKWLEPDKPETYEPWGDDD